MIINNVEYKIVDHNYFDGVDIKIGRLRIMRISTERNKGGGWELCMGGESNKNYFDGYGFACTKINKHYRLFISGIDEIC